MKKTEKNIIFTDIPTKSICNKFNRISIDDCNLLEHQVDIWQFPLNKLWKDALVILNSIEQKRAARLYFDKHRNRFIAAHAFLRTIISRYLKNKNPNALEFSENKYGKPILNNNQQNLEFNLSHSDDIGLLAIGKHHHLGVDVECFSAREYLNLAEYMFSQKELLAIKNINANMQPLVFFNIWAQKEAFIKACGMGLSYPTQDFDVTHLSANRETVIDKKINKNWKITSFRPTITSCGAICYSPEITNIRYLILEDYCDIS